MPEGLDLFADWENVGDAAASMPAETMIGSEEDVEEKPAKLESSKEKLDLKDPTKKEEVNEDLFDFDKSEEEATPKGLETLEKTSSTKSTLEYLKSKGLIDYEVEEGEELEDEDYEDILNESLDQKLNSKLEEVVSTAPPEAKEFMKFLFKGGNPAEYFKVAEKQYGSGITEDIDLEVEANQEKLMRAVLAEEGNESEEVEDMITYLKDSGKLKLQAEKKSQKWFESKKAEKENLIKEQEARIKSIQEQRKKLKTDFSDFLGNTSEIDVFKFNKKDKEELPDYITSQSVKLQNGASITEMQKDLQEVLQDKEKTVLLAKILKSKFDFSAIKNKVESKVTKDIKDTVRRKSPHSSNKSKGFMNIADMFED